MSTAFDAIVVGMGATGSATAYQLARRGVRVLGLDRYDPPHARGSTHGDTRITRLAIGEGAQYTPLAMRSHALWRELEQASGTTLLTTCGGLWISSAAKASKVHVERFFTNTVAAAERFGIAHEILDAPAIRRRFPQFAVRDDEVGYYEATAGFVRPEACVRAHLAQARAHGAELHVHETVTRVEPSGRRVMVSTDRATYRADRVVIAAGPWLPQLLRAELARPFRVSRQALLWFEVDEAARFAAGRFPVFIWELQRARQAIYGFPAVDGPAGGIKCATEQFDATTTPDAVDRIVGDAEAAETWTRLVAPHLPGVGPRCVRASTCLYTCTPDFGFVIDRHPDSDRMLIASPCSGHGFKHSAALGEALAELVGEGRSTVDLASFRLARFR
jgi:sarcosine oxidase